MKTIRKFFVIFIPLFFAYYIIYGGGSFTGRYSIDELKTLFNQHTDSFEKLVEICKEYPHLNRYFAGKESASYFYETTRNDELIALLNKLLDEIPAVALICERVESLEGDPLFFVRVPVFTSGLSVSGSGVSAIFQTERGRGFTPYVEVNIVEEGYYVLPEEGWYIRVD